MAFMPSSDQTHRPRHDMILGCTSLCLSSFVGYQSCKHDILKINELMQLGTSGLQGKGIKRSVLGVRRLKIKTTRGQNRSQHSLPARFLQNYANQTRRAHITVTVRCVTTSRMQKVNGSRSHKDVDRFGRVAEGSFSTTVGYSSFSALALCGRHIACHGTSATSVGHFPPRTYSPAGTIPLPFHTV